jgi:L-amino acid N-acyltransferase YncA
MIREVQSRDVRALCAIYNHYVEHTIVTFATEPIGEDEMAGTIVSAGPNLPWLVWDDPDAGIVTGYAACGPWKSRCAYRHSLETTIYMAPGHTGRGLGRLLYAELLERIAEAGYHSVLGGIALPNPASVALHEHLGFTQVAHFREVGRKFDRWIDVGYWQKVLAT